MTWVRFIKDFSFKPTVNSTIDYKFGHVVNVVQRCADEAIAKGAAEPLAAPKKTAAASATPKKSED